MEVWIWALVIVAAVIVEMLTTQMICIWFVGGALAGWIAHALHAPLWLQVIVAAVVTLALLIGTRPFVRRFLEKNKTATNADRVVGETAVVTEPIDNLLEQGRVRVLGSDWRAKSANGQPIENGARVTVKSIEGVKLIVEAE